MRLLVYFRIIVPKAYFLINYRASKERTHNEPEKLFLAVFASVAAFGIVRLVCAQALVY